MTDFASVNDLRRIYAETKTIAVVGASPDTNKAAGFVPRYLKEQGYRIVPVNPGHEEILGEICYPTLLDVPDEVDVVDVFRPGAEAPEVAISAAAIGAKVFWMQLEVVSEEAAAIAAEAGMTVVMDRCMGQMHAKLGLGPGPRHGD